MVEREEFGDSDTEMEDCFFSPSPAARSLLKRHLSDEKDVSDSDSDSCLLKKAAIICSLKDRIANGSVPEGILDSLLLIEQIDCTQGLPVSDSMRAAFTAVALHCTLSSLPLSWYSYFESVRRIWGLRLRHLEDSRSTHLIGPELTQWRVDVEAAIWDSEASERLLRLNTQGEALLRLMDYLEEARSLIKPAFLRLFLTASVDPIAQPTPPVAASAAQPSSHPVGAAAQPSSPPVGAAASKPTLPDWGKRRLLFSF